MEVVLLVIKQINLDRFRTSLWLKSYGEFAEKMDLPIGRVALEGSVRRLQSRLVPEILD